MKTSIKIVVLLAAGFFLCACVPTGLSEEVRIYKIIPEAKKKVAAAWIIKVVTAANPHSDEEPEDNIKQAEKTAIELFGVQTVGILMSNVYGYYEFIPYERCNERQKALINKWKNKGQEK